MKILLVGNYPEDRQKSMKAFADMLFRNLSALGHEVDLFLPHQFLVPKGKRATGIWKWAAYIDKFVISSVILFVAARRYDLVHVCDHSNAMYWPFICSRPNAITCHDVIAIQAAKGLIPGWRVSISGRLFQLLILRSLTRFDTVVCDSHLTRSDLLSIKKSVTRAITIHIGLNDEFYKTSQSEVTAMWISLGRRDMTERRYILHVGSDLPRKNRKAAFNIYSIMAANLRERNKKLPYLVFVGPCPNTEMATLIAQARLTENVIFLSDVSHEYLRNLYSGASLFIFPSLNEGFGWPIVEAQACGCPVLTTDKPPMNEVGGGAAVYFNLDDEQDAASRMMEAIEHPDLIVTKGLRNAAEFSDDVMASRYAEEFTNLIRVRGTH